MKTYVKKCIDLVSKLLTITTAHYVLLPLSKDIIIIINFNMSQVL